MRTRLADILACPDCHVALRLEARACDGEETVSGALTCSRCGKAFPIERGVPRFVPTDSYASSFSFEWRRWRRTQFDTATRTSSRSTFEASTGHQPEELAGKFVLDAGCGSGRYTDLLSSAGAEIVGVDMSLAVEVAQQNLAGRPNSHFVQGDLMRLPFLPASFDFIFSIGVLHHTANTHDAFSQLLRALRPGGEIAIWVYPLRRFLDVFEYFPGQVNQVLGHDVSYQIPPRWQPAARRFARPLDWIIETSSEVERIFTTRLPTRLLYWLSHAAIPLYYLYRIPLFYPLRLVTRIAMDPDPEWRVLNTFDWYSPRYQWKHRFEELRGWCEEAGLEEVIILPRVVAVRGRKPVRHAEGRQA
jgi:SAM-dependent methyltransferase